MKQLTMKEILRDSLNINVYGIQLEKFERYRKVYNNTQRNQHPVKVAKQTHKQMYMRSLLREAKQRGRDA